MQSINLVIPFSDGGSMNDRNKLERNKACYRDLLTKWLHALTGDHPNAIWRQLDHMVNDEAWFKFVIRLRKRAGNPPVNDHLWNIFVTGYGVKQSLAIRRLTDPNPRTASLLSLILALDRNKPLLTREVMVGHDGTAMDVDALFQQLSTFQVGSCDAPLAAQRWSDAKYAHEAFDRLRDASPCIPRSPSDRVSDEVVGALKDALTSKAILRVRHRCDKYLAHADLSDLTNDVAGPTYNDIHESIQTLVHVDQFLRVDIFKRGGSAVLSTYQGNAFRELSAPLVPAMESEVYEQEWREVASDIERWGKVEQFRRFAVHPDIHE